jgi:hypothetical protein
VSNTWELASSRDDLPVAGSETRRLSAGAGVTWRTRDDLALSFGAAVDPWVDGLGSNAIASVRSTLGLTWAR